jgi:hypothetical protein
VNILDVVRQVVAALEGLDVPYVLVGSIASSARGIPRTTNDADIVADLRHDHAAPLAAALQGRFYVDVGTVIRAISQHRSFNAIHLETGFKIDVFVPPPGGFGWQQLARRLPERLGAEGANPVSVATAEDTVIAKLEWYRASGEASDRQWLDLVGVIKVQGPAIDGAYLREWSAKLGLTALLDRALMDAGLEP